MAGLAMAGLAMAGLVLAAAGRLGGCSSGSSPAGASSGAGTSAAASAAAAGNPNLDLGSSLGDSPAPDFRLTNQFGQPMSLSQFRGKVVMLAFVDSRCTN
ncbi:MAG: redoxin domain-containing protein, partial [Nocardiopsaceae bacterium]|nr:redoxin domain-containing protein [Nocardiopsaceae bacterium]